MPLNSNILFHLYYDETQPNFLIFEGKGLDRPIIFKKESLEIISSPILEDIGFSFHKFLDDFKKKNSISEESWQNIFSKKEESKD